VIPALPPTPAEVRERLSVSTTAVPDDELTDIVNGETSAQQAACTVVPYVADLRLALFRRCARTLAAKGVPLGILADEFGQTPLRAVDSEIARLEARTPGSTSAAPGNR
jgi:hypothetical protein